MEINTTCPLEKEENKIIKDSVTYLQKQVGLIHLNELYFLSRIDLLLKGPLQCHFSPRQMCLSIPISAAA